MNGNRDTGAQEERRLRFLFTYQGSAFVGEDVQDGRILLTLTPDASPETLASAVINFPMLDGRKVLFVHELNPYKGGEEEKKILLEAMEVFAGKRGYQAICIYTRRQEGHFLKAHGFRELPGKILAEKEIG